ncbi:receptor-like protein 12 [Vigna radiata var. radiata]|uniref:Receptor-like protein 12 n=1 Tax=Vigna radiata var. radiata TaxID=3916 RepID=A0A1S3V0T4_VIGRR|nr:receptor-like protein 12 [Vigna radiata var. radiata]
MKISLVSWFYFTVYCWTCLVVHIVSDQCNKDERSQLLQLKNNLTFEPESSNKLSSWNQRSACCEWRGVTCDEEGRVTGLDLSEESIAGGFDNSSSLFSLRHLQNLNLSYNNFNSEIPSAFNKLENLTTLSLAYAGFVGQVPIQISQLTKLVTLDLSSQAQEVKLENPSLLELVRNLTKLRQLYLDGVSVSGGAQEWQTALLQIPTLEELSMLSCYLSGPLLPSLARLENLSVLDLSYNNLACPVPETFAHFKSLTSLKLTDCELIGIFPEKIFQIPTLSYIDISDNYDLSGFFHHFLPNGSLHTMFVSDTNFSGPLPNSIGNLRNLSNLDLSSSQFSGTLPNSLQNLTQLVDLDLSGNRLSGSVPALHLCKQLQSIYLTDNTFTGTISLVNFQDLVNLEYLNLDSNFFTGTIPSSIFTLPSLHYLHLSNNKFEGQLDFTNTSYSLQSLDLSGNLLEGSFPISLFELTNLESLSLSSNNFSGTIEVNLLGKLENLTTLDISNNTLTINDISTPLTRSPLFPSLKVIGLASCKLTKFPQFLKNHSLRSIDLSNNHIAGTIPHWLWNNNALENIDLSYNYLTDWEEPMFNNFSFLPPKIDKYLRKARFLSIANNNIQGSIPESICDAPNLRVLDLSNNSLTGTIPKCLIAMNGTISILDLGRNKLSGTIDTCPGLCSLRTLHLNGNSLHGKLPKYLANCAMMEILDIGDNQIHDEFPCWFENMTTLRVLILRSNKINGSLKCERTEVAWPQLQIFDLASNNLGGRIPLAFFGSWKAMIADESDQRKLGHLQSEVLEIYSVFYNDRVTVTSKGQRMYLAKILIIFTVIDLSCNKFEGLIPGGLGQLNAVHILNLSHNTFSGSIPSSFGNMKDLESLDLSNNNLSGSIPTQLAHLSFLSFLNLSCNHLMGRIPTGTQIQSFPADSFSDNDGLCGPPLSENCSVGDGMQVTPSQVSNSNAGVKISFHWNFISFEVGFTSGVGIIVFPLLFHKPWRKWYWKCVEDILYHTFPQLDFVYERHGGQSYRTLRWKPQ